MTTHSDLINSTIDQLRETIEDYLLALEEQIIAILDRTPPGVNPRPQIVQTYEQFAALIQEVRSSLIPLSDAVVGEQIAEGFGTVKTFEDIRAEEGLLAAAQASLSSSVLSHSEVIAGIAGTALIINESPQLTRARIRGAISGVMMRVSDPTTRRLQTQLRRLRNNPNADTVLIRGLTQQIRDRLPQVETRGSLIDQQNRTVESVVMRYNNTFTYNRAEREGATHYRYSGTTDSNTRDWCRNLVGDTMTEAEIRELWATSSWGGREPGDPFIVAGGYNCRHHWEPTKETA